MFYTVINKSGWTSDQWRVYGTYGNRKDAKFAAYGISSPDPKNSFYRTKVVKHKHSIGAKANWDNMTVKFGRITAVLNDPREDT